MEIVNNTCIVCKKNFTSKSKISKYCIEHKHLINNNPKFKKIRNDTAKDYYNKNKFLIQLKSKFKSMITIIERNIKRYPIVVEEINEKKKELEDKEKKDLEEFLKIQENRFKKNLKDIKKLGNE